MMRRMPKVFGGKFSRSGLGQQAFFRSLSNSMR